MTQKIAYVTGGMGGIGTSMCQRLHRDGFKVIAGCGPSRDHQKWIDEQKALGFTFYFIAVLILRIQREIVARKIRALRLMQAEPASAPVFGIPAQ